MLATVSSLGIGTDGSGELKPARFHQRPAGRDSSSDRARPDVPVAMLQRRTTAEDSQVFTIVRSERFRPQGVKLRNDRLFRDPLLGTKSVLCL